MRIVRRPKVYAVRLYIAMVEKMIISSRAQLGALGKHGGMDDKVGLVKFSWTVVDESLVASLPGDQASRAIGI